MTCFQIRQLCLSLIFLGPYLSFLLRCVIMMKLYHRLGFHDGLKTEGVKWTPSSLTERAQSHRTARKLWGEKYWRHQTSLSSGKLNLCWGKQQQQQKQGICQASCLSEDKLPLNQLSTPLLKCRLSSLPQGYRCSSGFPFQEGEEPGCLAPLLEITSPQFLWKTVPTAQLKCSYRACPVGYRTCPVGYRSLNLKVSLKHWTNLLWSFSNKR